MSLSQTNLSCANVGANNITLTVIDTHGASAFCTGVVTVVDSTDPLQMPEHFSLSECCRTANITGAMVNNGSTDACGIASLSASPSTFTCANVGTNNNITVTDVNGDQHVIPLLR